MTKAQIALGVDLFQIYKGEGRDMPATWIARAVGVSPTTMLKHLSETGYTGYRGFVIGRGWNWSGSPGPRKLAPVKVRTNGNVIELGPEVPGPAKGENPFLSFDVAMKLVKDGLAVARRTNCHRVIFKKQRAKHPFSGVMDDDGFCSEGEPYVPTFQDIHTQDWFIMIGNA